MIPRYFGMDIHKNYVVVAAVDGEQEAVLKPGRVEMAALPDWIAAHLTLSDQVAVEVNANAWPLVDLLRQTAGEVVVTNPYKTKLIAQARIKNDKVDALALARLLAAGFTAEVWVPDAETRDRRALAAHRARLQRQCTRAKNRAHAVLRRHNLRCPEKSLFTAAGRTWMHERELPMVDDLQLRHLLRQLDGLEGDLDEADRLIARLAVHDPRVPRLMQLTGVGCYTAFAALAVIGTIHRFPSPGQLASYAGLVPTQHQSGGHDFHGHITKAGNPLLRWLMVEAARVALRWDDHWRQAHDHIARRRGSNIATVAVARKLLVTIWYLLTDQSTYYYLRPQTFVTKLQNWAFRIGREALPASSSQEFVYEQLVALDLPDLAKAVFSDPRKGRLVVQLT
jgi:transposase